MSSQWALPLKIQVLEEQSILMMLRAFQAEVPAVALLP
jgi:hypothetical protein